jgi:hypothetical protein
LNIKDVKEAIEGYNEKLIYVEHISAKNSRNDEIEND